jgi:hypothetical protein
MLSIWANELYGEHRAAFREPIITIVDRKYVVWRLACTKAVAFAGKFFQEKA